MQNLALICFTYFTFLKNVQYISLFNIRSLGPDVPKSKLLTVALTYYAKTLSGRIGKVVASNAAVARWFHG